MRQKDRQGALDEIFEGLVPPAPPRELKGSVIAGAHAAWQNDSGSDRWARLWYHRGLRSAWVGVVVLLLCGHIFVPSGRSTGDVVVGDARPDVEMAEFLRPTRIVAAATPNVGRFRPDAFEVSRPAIGDNS